MTSLSFTLLQPLERPLDASPLTPGGLEGLSPAGIQRLVLRHGEQAVRLDRLFAVRDGDRQHLHLGTGSRLLYGVGRGMSAGRITVAGDCGDFAGQAMSGGQLRIAGNVGDFAGQAMSGGQLHIAGDAGDFLGAAVPGQAHGLCGGLITVLGNAGARLGDRMRRGGIVIRGDAGAWCASRLQAGTIVVLGRVGYAPAWGMRRGSVILTHPPRHLLRSFRTCGPVQLQFLPLLFRQLSALDEGWQSLQDYGPCALRVVGDAVYGARGEILILRDAVSSSGAC